MLEKDFQDSTGASSSTNGSHDVLLVIMEQCKNAEKGNTFVQQITCAPEPMAVLSTRGQLSNLERFCCDVYGFCIFGIDST